MQAIGRALKVRADEWRLVLLVGSLALCLQAGQGLGDNAASALFFLRYGVEFLPFMYLLLGISTSVLTLAYSAGLGHFRRQRFFESLILGLILILLFERAVLTRPFAALYPILWLTVSCMGMILGTFTWNLAGDVSDPRQAKRLFPLFASAGILGSVLGNALTGLVARTIGTENLLLLYAALLGLAFILTRAVAQRYFRPPTSAGKPSTVLADLRSGFDFVRGSPLMRLVATASILFSILFFSIAFPFSKVVSASFPDEAGVAGFLGLFTGITTTVTFLVSLLLANRLYTRLGIVNSVMLMPLVYLFAFVVFAGWYSLPAGVIARFAQMVVLGGIASTAWSALFNVVPSQKRGQVLAFENGLPSQVGVALSGVLLILGERVLAPNQILLMGTFGALACGWLVWRMRAAYGEALVQALQAGRLEVFSSEAAGFSGLQGDAAALSVVTRALDDSKPSVRLLAAEILGKMQTSSAVPALTRQLSDAEPTVRAAVLRALGALHAQSALDGILAALDDANAEVREEALRALMHLEVNPRADLSQKLDGLLDDPALRVRELALVTLAKLGDSQNVHSHLKLWSQADEVQMRTAALGAFAQAAPYVGEGLDVAWVLRSLEESSPQVRAAACHALGALVDQLSAQALAAGLSDPHLDVRSAAARALKRRGAATRDIVLAVLYSEDARSVDAALDALSPGDDAAVDTLRSLARARIPGLRTLRAHVASLPTNGHAVTMLREALQRDSATGEGRLIRILGLIGNPDAMRLVANGLRSSGSEARAAALEALETLGDKTLTGSLLSLLEEEPQAPGPAAVLSSIMESGSIWNRALAIRAAQELGLRELVGKLRACQSDPETLVRETAHMALSHFGEAETMDTLEIVPILERVLLLRVVPIFSDLSAEDLQQVAGIAREDWYPDNTEVCHEGDEGDMLYIIADGQLDVLRSGGGQEQRLATRGPGDFVGEMAVIESAPRSATLRARGDVRVLAIEGETFRGILRERPEVSLAVIRSLSRRLRDVSVSNAA